MSDTAPPCLDLHRLMRWESALVVLLIGTIVLGDQLSPAFLKSGNFFYIGLNIGEVAIIALPLALIVITGEIDLSVASMLGLSGTILADLTSRGLNIWLSMAITLVLRPAHGPLQRPARDARRPAVARRHDRHAHALPRHRADRAARTARSGGFPEYLTNIGVVPIPHTQIPWSIAIFAVLAVAFAITLHATPLGRAIFAIGSNQEAAYFSGIRVKRIKLGLFVLSGPVLRDRRHPLLAALRERALRRRHGPRAQRRADRAARRHLDLRRARDDARPRARGLRDRGAAERADART